MNRVVIGIGSVFVLAIAYFLISPLFIDETVDEDLPFQNVTAGEQEQIMADARDGPDVVMEEDMPQRWPPLLRTGKFGDQDVIHKGMGDAKIYQLESGELLLRFENFRVTNGPALVVVLSSHPDPKSTDDVAEGKVQVAELKGNVGDQNYILDSTIKLEDVGSAIIYCRAFGVIFSVAPLTT